MISIAWTSRCYSGVCLWQTGGLSSQILELNLALRALLIFLSGVKELNMVDNVTIFEFTNPPIKQTVHHGIHEGIDGYQTTVFKLTKGM